MSANYRILFFLMGIIVGIPAVAEDWTAKVDQVQSTNLGLDCFYFTLSGVSVADPTLGNNSAWFAVPRTQFGAKDAYAMLLAAKISDMSVRVTTTGSTICGGYAQISQMLLQ